MSLPFHFNTFLASHVLGCILLKKANVCSYLADVDEYEDLLKVPTPPLSVMPIYQRDASKVLEKLLETLGGEGLKQHHARVPFSAQYIGTAQETYSTMLAIKKSLIENGLQEFAF